MRKSGGCPAPVLGCVEAQEAMTNDGQNAQPAALPSEAETMQTVQHNASRLLRIVAEACRHHPDSEDLVFTAYLLDMVVRSTIGPQDSRPV